MLDQKKLRAIGTIGLLLLTIGLNFRTKPLSLYLALLGLGLLVFSLLYEKSISTRGDVRLNLRK